MTENKPLFGCDCCVRHSNRWTIFKVNRYTSVDEYKTINVCAACFNGQTDFIISWFNHNQPIIDFVKNHRYVDDTKGYNLYLQLLALSDAEFERQVKEAKERLPRHLARVFHSHLSEDEHENEINDEDDDNEDKQKPH